MTIIKKLILSAMILSSTSLFAAGFDTPKEAFDFYFKLAVKAAEYDDKYGHYSKEHINALAPHLWSKRNPPQLAEILLSQHHGYIIRAQRYRDKYPMTVNPRIKGPMSARDPRTGIMRVYYSYYEHQHKENNRRLVKFKAKKIGNKIKWFII